MARVANVNPKIVMKRTNVELDENQLRILELKGNVTWEGNLDEWRQERSL